MVDSTICKKVRGKGKVPAKSHINLRLPEEVVAYFKQYPSYTAEMRAVLTAYVNDANNHTRSVKFFDRGKM